MSTKRAKETVTQEEADMEEVCRLVAEGKKVTDPELLERIRGVPSGPRRHPAATPASATTPSARCGGAIDLDDERELTPDQVALLRRGDARLFDPETGEEYVLVPVAEYICLRGK